MQTSVKVTTIAKAQSRSIALFVSDVHLQPTLPRTTATFLEFLEKQATEAAQLYLLGDLFEYWAGDDDISSPYPQQIVNALRHTVERGVQVFWIAGNRDFLINGDFAHATGIHLLSEPFVTELAGQRIAMVHGDAQCTDDMDYMAFRSKVRDAAWQQEFLSMPLTQRKSIIEGMRHGSQEAQRNKSYEIMDVNSDAITSLFEHTGATVIIHGHTHRPATHFHSLGDKQRVRYVLPDWDCETGQVRGGGLALYEGGSFQRFGLEAIAR